MALESEDNDNDDGNGEGWGEGGDDHDTWGVYRGLRRTYFHLYAAFSCNLTCARLMVLKLAIILNTVLL